MPKTTNTAQFADVVTLRTVADRVGLAPCSVSAILNNSAAALSIPERTRERVLRAAAQLKYRPNYSARSLRTKRTYTVAALVPDIGHAPAARIIAGAECFLSEHGYGLLIATYERAPGWRENYFPQLRQRGVEGVIAVQAKPAFPDDFPAAYVDLLCAYSPEPLSMAFRHQLESAGRNAAQSLVQQIEQSRISRFNRIASPDFSRTDTAQQSVTHFAD